MTYDPDFPDRPQHPDFWAMVEAVNFLDSGSDEGRSLEELCAQGKVDPESMIYMATQRAQRAERLMAEPTGTHPRRAQFAANWIDGFMTGLLVGITKGEVLLLDIDGNRRTGRGNG